MEPITRRDAAWAITRALTLAAGQPWLRGDSYHPVFFTADDFRILDDFTALLIPTDDTPGAREARVAPFIDYVVNAAAEYAPEMQEEWRRALAWLRARNFGQLPSAGQLTLVEAMAQPERDSAKKHDGFAVYRLIKDMTVRAFYTSRAGLIENLEYKGNAHLSEFPGCHHPEHRK